eukprot:NODE_469_length_7049_cov_0.468489.p5 type:complete len:197 gc:universal NODE_469_length_7049_cov_0.468489:6367-6957(+)
MNLLICKRRWNCLNLDWLGQWRIFNIQLFSKFPYFVECAYASLTFQSCILPISTTFVPKIKVHPMVINQGSIIHSTRSSIIDAIFLEKLTHFIIQLTQLSLLYVIWHHNTDTIPHIAGSSKVVNWSIEKPGIRYIGNCSVSFRKRSRQDKDILHKITFIFNQNTITTVVWTKLITYTVVQIQILSIQTNFWRNFQT